MNICAKKTIKSNKNRKNINNPKKKSLKNTIVKVIRRGGKSVCGQKLKVISTNSQGDKFTSLAGLVKCKSAAVFTVQETKSRKKGKHQLQGYILFEAIRKKFGGGNPQKLKTSTD